MLLCLDGDGGGGDGDGDVDGMPLGPRTRHV